MGNRILLNATKKLYLSGNEFSAGKRTVLLGALKEGLKSVWEFDETSGSTLVDQLGIQNLTKQSNVTINNTGKIDKCIYFPGASNSATNVFTNSAYSSLREYTVNVWIKDERIGSAAGAAYYMRSGTDATGFQLFADYRSTPYIRAIGQNYLGQNWLADIPAASMPTVNTWFMVTATMNIFSKTAKIYRNGTLISTNVIKEYGLGALTNNWTVTSLVLGTYYDGLTYDTCIPASDPCSSLHMKGFMDQLSIWTRELSPAEISALYNSGNGLAYSNWT